MLAGLRSYIGDWYAVASWLRGRMRRTSRCRFSCGPCRQGFDGFLAASAWLLLCSSSGRVANGVGEECWQFSSVVALTETRG